MRRWTVIGAALLAFAGGCSHGQQSTSAGEDLAPHAAAGDPDGAAGSGAAVPDGPAGQEQGPIQVDPGGGAAVTAEDLGQDWPFTVPRGRLVCEDWVVVFVTDEGDTYAVNGAARRQGIPDITPIWRDADPAGGGKVGIETLVSRGIELCDAPAASTGG